jgi:hypothetical protein
MIEEKTSFENLISKRNYRLQCIGEANQLKLAFDSTNWLLASRVLSGHYFLD